MYNNNNSSGRGGFSSSTTTAASGRGGWGSQTSFSRGSNDNGYGGGNGYSSGGYGGGYGGGNGGGYGGSNDFYAMSDRSSKKDWEKEELSVVKKDFYQECSEVTKRSEQEIKEWIGNNQVTLEGKDIPRPVFNFTEAGFPDAVLQRLNENYTVPTVIQSISWPIAMSGRDIISIAKTGSGKTLAFTLPGIVHTLQQTKRKYGDGPSVLVLLPTRELAQQVQEVAIPYCRDNGLSITCVFGGAAKNPQVSALRQGVDLLIGTPGRLLDLLDGGSTNLNRCSYVVLDEADRMLDMGFEPQMRRILGQVRPDRQTMMFSATWPKEVRALARDFQKDAAFLNVGSMELSANHNIIQKVMILQEHEKNNRLLELLDYILSQEECKTIVFCETKRKCDELTRGMRRDGWPVLSIHGDKAQTERDWVMKEFKAGVVPILLATDVAARGLDVDDIKFVINYDYPNNSEDYVHRIGRTGRRDKSGTAYTFFTYNNASKAADLIKVLSEANQEVSTELNQMASSSAGARSGGNRRYGGGGGGYGGGNRGYGGYGGYGGGSRY